MCIWTIVCNKEFIILHQKYYINYNYITITFFIIYCLYSYHNRWQLASENLIGTLCVVSGHFVFSFYIFLCLGNMFSIILCTMSNKILPYHNWHMSNNILSAYPKYSKYSVIVTKNMTFSKGIPYLFTLFCTCSNKKQYFDTSMNLIN